MNVNTVKDGKSGIYLIVNTISGKRYVGSAINIKNRIAEHKKTLRGNRHGNKRMQNSWNKHGEHNFKFNILATCPKEYLIKMEQWFIDTINPEYNICRVAGSRLGTKMPKDVVDRMSKNRLGKKLSSESIRKRTKTVSKTIYQYTLDGFFLNEFLNAREASKATGANPSGINYNATGFVSKNGKKTTSVNGFQFKYYKSERIPAVPLKKTRIAVFKDGVFSGVYLSLNECSRALNIWVSSLCLHINGVKSYSTVSGYTAKKISEAEYRELKTFMA